MIAPLSSRRILLVEDEIDIRELSARTLARAGYQVDAVAEAQSGWDALQARRYDLLITDNRMAGLSGSDLILKLRSAHIALPVILASGGIVPEQVAPGSAFQPVTALPKPFSTDQLLDMVAQVLRSVRRTPSASPAPFRASGESCLHWGVNE